MPNIQVTHDTDVNNARSESSLVVNPRNPQQIVAASKRFNNIYTYDFTLATEYSADGGHSWHDSAPFTLTGFTVMTDPAMAWDDSGNVFMVGLAGHNPPTWDTNGIVVYKSTDAGKTWGPPAMIHTSTNDDKQWAAGDAFAASPHHGNVYAVWDDPAGIIDFARTTDHGATWRGHGAGSSPAGGAIISDGSHYPEINVGSDGRVYVVSINGSSLTLYVSSDGGDTFTAKPNPATGITPIDTSLPYVAGFPVFPGGTFRVLTDPTACAFGDTVTVAWADYREGQSRIYFSRSTDGGDSWSSSSGQPLLTGGLPPNVQHFHPQIVTDDNGVIGCAFYEFGPKPTTLKIDVIMAQSFDGGASFNHFTVTDQPWDPAVNPPLSHGSSNLTFIGDYFGLDASPLGFHPLWTDTRTGIQELFTSIVPEKHCAFIVNRSTLGQDEVDARRHLPGPNAVIPDAFRVAVDGYTAAQLGVTSALGTLNVASPAPGITVRCTGNVAETGSYGSDAQRFTFLYDLDFGSTDTAFGFSGPTRMLTLHVAVVDVSAAAEIELIKQPNPYILHGDPSWLSVDLRLFVMRAGDTKFGHTMGSTATDAVSFIQQAAKSLSNGGGTASGQSFDDPAVLTPDEEGSALYVQPTDEHGHPVFNFALARVRYVGLIGAQNVRVFFRLFQAQSTNASYDFPPGTAYRRATNLAGQPIPLAGIRGNDYITMPFFALPRVNATSQPMSHQTDSRTAGGQVFGNVQRITAHSNGSEVDTFFGCWLDLNQPGTPVIPATKDAVHPDGPFQSMSNPPLPLQQAILRSLHQCLVAEVAFDPVSIPLGKDPSNWDKLAQRNIAWSDVGSATAVTTFEVRPSPAGLGVGQRPDELMIDWGTTPRGSTASLHLPAVDADDILQLASRMYVTHRLSRVDEHTISCPVGGISYLPLPPGGDEDYAGLLTVDPPDSSPAAARDSRPFTVVVRQVTNALAANERKQKRQPARDVGEHEAPSSEGLESSMGRTEYTLTEWRRVLGSFQLTAPHGDHATLLRREERQLAVLLAVLRTVPRESRWFPVFQRYVEVIGGRVRDFGGDPTTVQPSGWGEPRPAPPGHGHPRPGKQRTEHSGKVAGLAFDHFGDFEGFILATDEGERRYRSRERGIELLAERAWRERLRVSVYAEPDEPRDAAEVILWEPPRPI